MTGHAGGYDRAALTQSITKDKKLSKGQREKLQQELNARMSWWDRHSPRIILGGGYILFFAVMILFFVLFGFFWGLVLSCLWVAGVVLAIKGMTRVTQVKNARQKTLDYFETQNTPIETP
ncbi:hypothetical protein KIPB_009735 [Kipferlia bialata]|uniref:Uncharacterized protein n=1 Tax=Kipferlia bialata TaxID=797122 RepID=A0A391P5D4_9EUKA|nr:hypothetical protein KIPB_009735 [Kipferlia bialata]|eukprot:g9735.t1